MKKILNIVIALFGLLIISLSAEAQKNFSGAYKYEVRNTPYGDYFGVLTLRKVGEKYEGEFVNNKGKKYPINFFKVRDNKMIFSSNIEDTDNSMVSCVFVGDSIKATIEVKGDNFLYKLNGEKTKTKNNKGITGKVIH